jgi:P pilus assembly chaperone PapD
MKILTYCGVFVLLTLISFPVTAEAFSRRTHSSEVAQNQGQPSRSGRVQNPGQSAPNNGQSQTLDITPQAVPEPPAILLMGIGIGLFAVYSIIKGFRGQDASRDKAM